LADLDIRTSVRDRKQTRSAAELKQQLVVESKALDDSREHNDTHIKNMQGDLAAAEAKAAEAKQARAEAEAEVNALDEDSLKYEAKKKLAERKAAEKKAVDAVERQRLETQTVVVNGRSGDKAIPPQRLAEGGLPRPPPKVQGWFDWVTCGIFEAEDSEKDLPPVPEASAAAAAKMADAEADAVQKEAPPTPDPSNDISI